MANIPTVEIPGNRVISLPFGRACRKHLTTGSPSHPSGDVGIVEQSCRAPGLIGLDAPQPARPCPRTNPRLLGPTVSKMQSQDTQRVGNVTVSVSPSISYRLCALRYTA